MLQLDRGYRVDLAMLGGGLRTMYSQRHHWQIFVAKAEMVPRDAILIDGRFLLLFLVLGNVSRAKWTREASIDEVMEPPEGKPNQRCKRIS